MAMYLPCSDTVLPYRVSPFGYLRVYGYLLLTAAFRSLSRPSSAPDAKSFSYALYSLTNLVWFLNYIRIRDLFEIEVFTHILSYIEKPFHISLITNLVIGV